MFPAVPHTLPLYQHTTALIKYNLFLPRALQATDCSSAILKNPGKPVSSCLATSQDDTSLCGKQEGEQADLLPVTEGQLIILKTEVVSKWKSPERNSHNEEQSSGLSHSCTSWKPVRSPDHAVFPSLFHHFSVIQKSLLTELAFDARNHRVCEKLDIMTHEGTEVSRQGSKNGMGSSSPKRQPYSPSHRPQGEWAETVIPGLFVACF